MTLELESEPDFNSFLKLTIGAVHAFGVAVLLETLPKLLRGLGQLGGELPIGLGCNNELLEILERLVHFCSGQGVCLVTGASRVRVSIALAVLTESAHDAGCCGEGRHA